VFGTADVVVAVRTARIAAYVDWDAHIGLDNWSTHSVAIHLDTGDARCRADDSSSFWTIEVL
jgi:hypothetical protein